MYVALVAVSRNGIIGVNNTLPWSKVKEDMAHFKSTTLHQYVVMGYNTYKSLPRSLPHRHNVVIDTKEPEIFPMTYQNEDKTSTFTTVHPFQLKEKLDYLTKNNPHKDVCFIGGMSVYRKVLSEQLVDTLYLTRLDLEVNEEDFPENSTFVRWDENLLKGYQCQELYPLEETTHKVAVYKRKA